jgi:hypothetical protein
MDLLSRLCMLKNIYFPVDVTVNRVTRAERNGEATGKVSRHDSELNNDFILENFEHFICEYLYCNPVFSECWRIARRPTYRRAPKP